MAPYDALLPVHTADRDDIHAPIAAMRAVVREHGDPHEERLLIGELYLPIDRLVHYYGRNGEGLQMPSNMHLIACDWRPAAIAALIDRYEAALPAGAWPNWVLGNHDRSRIASRVGRAQARVAAMLLLTLRGTPTLYYGDELAMTDVPIAPEQVRDPYEQRVRGLGAGRDPERSPMQWTAGPYAGFCPPEGTPWLPVAADHEPVNVETERADARSMLTLHRRLLALRRSRQALASGSYQTLHAAGGVLAYRRATPNERVLVALNLTGTPRPVPACGQLLLSTMLDGEGQRVTGGLQLRADEGVVLAEEARG
jgi:alpha-glucosidase